MRKLFLILIIAGFFTGCYDAFRLDNPTSSVAFSTADGGSNITGVLHRTVVKDEGLKLDVGINLGGILENQKDRWADFVIDPALLDDEAVKVGGYELMPSDYYTLSNTSRFEIKAGSILGKVTVTLDSAKFVKDPKTVGHVYAIPFRLTDTSEDTINASLCTKVIAIKYINHYEGDYDQTGSAEYYNANEKKITDINFKNVISYKTLSIDSAYSNGMIDKISADYVMKLLRNADNSVFLKEILNPATGYVSIYEGYYKGVINWESRDDKDVVKKSGADSDSLLLLSIVDSKFKISTKLRHITDKKAIKDYSFNVDINPDNTISLSAFACDSVGSSLVSTGENLYDPSSKKITLNYKITFANGNSEVVNCSLAWNSKNRDKHYVFPTGSNTYDPSTSTFTLNYKLLSMFGDYYIVSTKMVWRNRIRDGINEWRR
jgi:hypothetical protein